MTPQRVYPQGVPSWIDIEQDSPEDAMEFYGGLFGWTFQQATPADAPFSYFIAQVDGRDAAGIGGPVVASGEPSPAWRTYIAVDDAAATADRVVAAGGRVVRPPTAAGEGGISVAGVDPAGVEFYLWQAERRLGAQITNTPGAWNFSDLHASGSGVREFYTAVFGWSFDDIGYATMVRLPGYGDHLAATIDPGIHERQAAAPPGFADAIAWTAPAGDGKQPHWHVTFTVSDRDRVADTAERIGGTVLARSDSEWTKDALIRDPQSAEFTISQFTPPAA